MGICENNRGFKKMDRSVKIKCPICHAKLNKGKEIMIGNNKYLYTRCMKCYYEDKIYLHESIKIKNI
jgi:ribosomal protein S27E